MQKSCHHLQDSICNQALNVAQCTITFLLKEVLVQDATAGLDISHLRITIWHGLKQLLLTASDMHEPHRRSSAMVWYRGCRGLHAGHLPAEPSSSRPGDWR